MKKEEHWFNTKWRPAMGWSYLIICVFDFIIGPQINYAFFKFTGQPFTQWVPLTMGEGGMYHLSMGAIVGITSYTRGKEKITKATQESTDVAEQRDNVLNG